MNIENQASFQKNEALTFGAAAAIVSLMMFCVGMTAMHFMTRLTPALNLQFLPWVTMVVAAEAIYSQQFVHRWTDLSWERITYRVSEILVILFSIKVVFYIRNGLKAFQEEISEYGLNFAKTFFSNEFTTILIISFLVWMISSRIAGLLLKMGRDIEILEPGARPDFFSNRAQVRKDLAGLSFFVGAVMIIFGTFARQQLEFVWGNAPVVEATSLNIVVYFVLTLILLSLGQFSVLRGRWGWERTPIQSDIGKAWLKYAALFFVIVFVLIIFLPTGYSLSFFQTFGILLEFIVGIVGYLLFLIILPFLLFLSRMRGEEDTEVMENPFEPLMPDSLPVAPVDPISTGVPVVDWVRSVFFWAVFLFVIFYAFIQFARNNEVLWQRLKSIAVFRLFLNAWLGVRDWLFGVGKGAQDLVQAGVRQIRSFGDRNTQEQIWDFIGINRLSPRLRIFFFYQAMLRRGREKNIAKSESQTPAEYREKLAAAFPEAEEDVREMTEEFETARYSRQKVDEEDATKTKSIWARLRARMRRKRG